MPPNTTTSTISSLEMDDPWHTILRPDDETPEQRSERLAAESQARELSDLIDHNIQREAQEETNKRLRGRMVRVLLLGQSESGKSTLQRQFTLIHAPDTFDIERPSLRLVIFLNVVRSVQRILKSLKTALDRVEDVNDPISPSPSSPRSPVNPPLNGKSPATYVNEMTLRLSPITGLEQMIINTLVGVEEQHVQQSASSSKSTVIKSSGLTGVLEGSDREFFVRPNATWKRATLLSKLKGKGGENPRASMDSTAGRPATVDWSDKDDPGHIIHMCGPEIIALWSEPWVRSQLRHMRVRLEEGSGFFLNDLDRITATRYLPTDDDILRARIKTVGVSEYVFPRDIKGVEWKIYDVGGARSQRHAWVPYFDNVDAIIFLAPLSPFDTALAEDRKLNCLEDSLLLWKEICTNKLLLNVPLVLFLNKSDLLRKKLEDGIQVRKYVVSYGDRPNTYDEVEQYFKAKFDAIFRQQSSSRRPVFTHITSCVNRQTTSAIIGHIQDILLRANLETSALM
ncbi:hypothetical protein FRB96_009314 [Tulasnella sp. 330]|nr:hypothetical protein FRB96_009314 [Tulasnella sp. 330]KAG8874896.1 hypothetical protein FRB97_005556 [Tulasnella sp. 331]KAG8879696.1 hypothetical protein FRB98_005568 [Tulasnella sp. 332]